MGTRTQESDWISDCCGAEIFLGCDGHYCTECFHDVPSPREKAKLRLDTDLN